MVELRAVSTMGLNIKNPEVEQLASEVAAIAHETKTEAIRQALIERRARLRARGGKHNREDIRRFLEREVWPLIADSQRGCVLTREEEDELLGYGPHGY